ncbi:M3 family oligoendopeptidase [Salipaludibacillus sp. LMS25]|jgi:oligoendopeptidase F|uniref:M3 family oligoendopeptidase n=1 Tax=Salipaludibacillus sp. LMS25 TaxID=2924031 RepID=UPI0020D1128A|nr:M3 family oligoendopeptidase [Salipaludibacillus sp. LMS25]UTR14171.1 M3 family oligoendopeptidase [Salipaludibacillus sp. LMS25]
MATYYKEKIDFHNLKAIEARFTKLLNTPINSAHNLESWLIEQSTFLDEIEEGLTGHYIDFQCYSHSEEKKRQFEYDQQMIEPLVKKYNALLDEKFLASPYKEELNSSDYAQFIKCKQNAKALFREENISLEVDEDRLATNYFEYTSHLTVDWHGEEKTLSELSIYLENEERAVRKEAFSHIAEAFITIETPLQKIMDDLIQIRQKKAKNSGLDNYRDYMFKKYERFDYTPEDCKTLAEAVRKHVTPLKEKLQTAHKSELGVDLYRPWDTNGVAKGELPLKPFNTRGELVQRTTNIFSKMDSRFAELLTTMDERQMLDLTTRKGKSPGGFCTPLPVSKLSFIFMNASQTHDDMITLLHEMGHCIHNDLKKNLKLNKYRDTPMESSELASMSMELLTMDQWDEFYENKTDFLRAKKEQLKGIINFLPTGVVVDQFQHWLYENPSHSVAERNAKFFELQKYYNSSVVDWSGYETWAESAWLRILHIFEVPFYFIEYVIAQLGALQMYKQYRENPERAMKNYKKALKLGSSRSLPDVYAAAGITFDFSETMIKELMRFLEDELAAVTDLN